MTRITIPDYTNPWGTSWYSPDRGCHLEGPKLTEGVGQLKLEGVEGQM